MPAYKSIQLVAYEADTLDLSQSSKFAVPSTPVRPDDPLRDMWNMTDEDARNRALQMYQLVELARTQGSERLGGADTLKIFLAPEFYFRDGLHRDSYQNLSTVNNIFAALLSAFRQDVYKDWLIVPGTIFWSQPAPGEKDKKLYFNTVCVVRGRSADFASGPAEINGVPVVRNGTTNQKELMSRIDYGRGVDKTAQDAAINPYFAPIIGDWAWRKGHLFTVQDILNDNGRPLVFGLEVCLEHGEHIEVQQRVDGGVLKQTLRQWPQMETGNDLPEVDIHIVTSCGMDIDTDNVCAKADGYVLACDGSPGVKPDSAIHRVKRRTADTAELERPLPEAWHANVPETLKLSKGGATQTIRVYQAAVLK